jgi:FdhD protein
LIFNILKYKEPTVHSVQDTVAEESPLLISASHTSQLPHPPQALALTMRTPGDEADLVRGFLFTEGIIEHFEDILSIEISEQTEGLSNPQEALVQMKEGKKINLNKIDRNLYISSSCGLCGKSTLENLQTIGNYLLPELKHWIGIEALCQLSGEVFSQQRKFKETGGMHATALFCKNTHTIVIREDVGRHNAMDKALGALALHQNLPFSNHIAFVSGRTSFELVQKAYLCGIPMLCSFGAPSSLAIELAQNVNMTLVGFLSKERCNIYSGHHRICLPSPAHI